MQGLQRMNQQEGVTVVVSVHQLDFAVRYSQMNRLIGDAAYSLLLVASRLCDKWRAFTGRNYWSLSTWMKSHVVQAEQAINAYQEAAVAMGREAGYDGIIFGTPTRFGNMASQMRNLFDQTRS